MKNKKLIVAALLGLAPVIPAATMNKAKSDLENQQEEVMIFRKGTLEDADALTKLAIYTWLNIYKDFVPKSQWPDLTYEARKQRIVNVLNSKDCVCIVCEINGEIVGMIFARSNQHYKDDRYQFCIKWLYIYPKYMRRGISMFLFKTLVDKLKTMGVHGLMLWCIEANKPAINFYKKLNGTMIENVEIPEAFHGIQCVVFTWDLK